tara:strand:+ start:1327 stop:1776 length:450 start_codon:yes stop_codon:yes gene_type:complete
MPSDDFRYIIVEIPENITTDLIGDIKKSIGEISVEEAVILNRAINVDYSEINIEDLDEDDLFHIGEDNIKIKRAIASFLSTAVDEVLIPRLNIEKRRGSPVRAKGFAYLEIGGKLYALTGDQVASYSSVVNKYYKYLLAINLSGIFNTN